MTYKLEFDRRALKEWQKLAPPIRNQFKKKLLERIENPCVPSAKLSGKNNRYKIKLRSLGYRLIYEVIDEKIILLVIAVGKREGNTVYFSSNER
ncbi:TPA: type II toxin-antitoxin system RelE family toxin [Providencia alcalifaciens]|uniref:type II toxin-antitoxin system RelE family toxin n=1 Tax=Providencia TaxID=586 RepID=UPI000452048A|nr:type II toxin-antitoxin system RelE/ParE family toxin [Providencia alcalifaciens]EAB6419113.1 type II toxin-antitoxin system RelE/ParE family toxin [Salmonella enterica subsp. enterica]EUC94247.1 toxin RelE [Providencia alcalifaciens PAL-2]MTB31553.1 type II toxin-antitoxin system mRNA interferase toxin, RelE/StbE family [Providencia alcalifaciens]CAG9435470.1 mRNA interferase toxin RelE [Providencia alcalifaciens]CAG9435753.1 mRNA interferase toxin RelE [Providencia alcalifaciens]